MCNFMRESAKLQIAKSRCCQICGATWSSTEFYQNFAKNNRNLTVSQVLLVHNRLVLLHFNLLASVKASFDILVNDDQITDNSVAGFLHAVLPLSSRTTPPSDVSFPSTPPCQEWSPRALQSTGQHKGVLRELDFFLFC